jgi:hypothetical protein
MQKDRGRLPQQLVGTELLSMPEIKYFKGLNDTFQARQKDNR